MARLFGVCCGLAIFSAVIFAGLLMGNPVEKIMLRALAGLGGGLVLGNFAGHVGLLLVHDHIPTTPAEAGGSPVAAAPESPPVVS